MEKIKKIRCFSKIKFSNCLKVIALILCCVFIVGCESSIGTQTGNPTQPTADQNPVSPSCLKSYENNGISLEYPCNWNYAVRHYISPDTFDYWDGDCESCGDTVEISFAGTAKNSPRSTIISSVIIYVITLDESFATLKDFLDTTRSDILFNEYTTPSLDGYIYEHDSLSDDGLEVSEIYFMNGNTLLYLVSEIQQEVGTADVIFNTLEFVEE